MEENRREAVTALRMIYGSALLNGPFSVIIAHENEMIGLTDRIMLRPLVIARKEATLYMASEEAAIREVCPYPDRVWTPKGGVPVMARLNEAAAVR